MIGGPREVITKLWEGEIGEFFLDVGSICFAFGRRDRHLFDLAISSERELDFDLAIFRHFEGEFQTSHQLIIVGASATRECFSLLFDTYERF